VWALFANADTINTIDTASDYPYIVAVNNLPWNKSLSCNCVLFSKDYLGITETLGVAKNIKPTSTEPTIGSMILLNEGPLGHVGVVLDIFDNEVWIVEANYKPCTITYRALKTDDPRIKGYR
jgi:hypothetical protein